MKVDKLVHSILSKNNKESVMKVCRYIDSSSGIFMSDWKKRLSYKEVEKLENDDVLQIQGTTNPLTRAAIANIC